MRIVLKATLALGIVACTFGSVAEAGYYCSPGFEATYGGRCVATASRDELDLYLNEATPEPYRPRARTYRHHHRVRHGLAERF